MSKISCNIIRDVLPLYVDDVVSEDTRSMVAEHMAQCEPCRKKCEEMQCCVSIPMDTGANPLKKFKKAWKRKKITLVCVTLIAALLIMCCAAFAVEQFVYQEEIAVNGAVYTQKGANVTVLPENSEEIGYLRGISFWSTASPTVDFMGTNLDGKYGGCPLYQSGTDDQVIYLEDFGGFYIPFVLSEYIAVPEE